VLDYSGHSTKLECPSLTAKAILYTAQTEPGLLDFSEESINNRSRADGLGKVIVCMQTSYMILQVLGRLMNHLPVTLLEVNTLCHVLCALALYSFWFHKPLDVSETISIRPKWAGPFDAIWSMRHRDFDVLRTRDARHCKIKEREAFDHFRHATLSLLYKKQMQHPKQTDLGVSTVEDTALYQCRRCGKPKRPVLPKSHLTASINSTRGTSRPNTFEVGSSAVEETVALLISPERRSHSVSRERNAAEIADEYRVVIAAGCTVEQYRQYKARTLPNDDDDAEEIVWNVAYSGRELEPGPPIDNERLVRATNEISFPSAEEWSKTVSITRERPSKFEIGTWEQTELVLVWHESIRSRLTRTPLWAAMTRVVLIEGYMSNVTFFRTAPDSVSQSKDDFAKADMISLTSLADDICAVQLDTAGIQRWENAFEAACEAKIMSTAKEQVTLDKAAMARLSQDVKDHLSIQSGFDLRGALCRWEASQENDFLRDRISNWPSSEEYLGSLRKFLPKAGMAVVTALYGGLHALAWHAEYPTAAERAFWRISTLVIAVSGALAGPLFLLNVWFERQKPKPMTQEATEIFTTVNDVEFQPSRWELPDGTFALKVMILYLLLIVIVIGYSLARVYIVLEAFMSLRSLPAGAFKTPNWTNLLLHW
jgi:hypothetical protein